LCIKESLTVKLFSAISYETSKYKIQDLTLIGLSPKGNPELKSLRALLRAMGMQLTVRPLRKRVA